MNLGDTNSASLLRERGKEGGEEDGENDRESIAWEWRWGESGRIGVDDFDPSPLYDRDTESFSNVSIKYYR